MPVKQGGNGIFPGSLNKTIITIGSLALLTLASTQVLAEPAVPQAFDPDAIPEGRYGDDVRLGLKIFTHTGEYASRYAGNDLNCSSCHLDNGQKSGAAPMWGAFGMYPAYLDSNDQNNTLQERIQLCFQYNLNGFKPGVNAPEVKALVSYIHFLSRGVPVGLPPPGRGFPAAGKIESAPNPDQGRVYYASACESCHGADGGGQAQSNDHQPVPPLWGMNSYSRASAFYDSTTLARFIQPNKPYDNRGSLSYQQAIDIAAYINQQIRPGDPRKGFLEGLLD